MKLEECKEAAVRGMQDAGFANVRAEHHAYFTDNVVISVRGACPCGLGESAMALGITPISAWPNRVYGLVHRSALKHIEEDRAEGRWKD